MGRPLNKKYFNSIPSGSNGDAVGSITITEGGSYTSIPSVSLTTAPELPGSVAATLGSVHMGALSATVSTIGTGDTDADYTPGDLLTVVGGTGTAATFAVTSVKIRTAANVADAGGFINGNTVTFSTGWSTPAVLTLTVDGGGAITGVAITNAGVRSTALPADPVTPNSTNGPGTLAGTTFNLGFGVNAVTLDTAGDLTSIPSNPAATTTDSADGTGATLTVAYEVIGVDVATGGSGYVAEPTVEFGSGAATADAVLANIGSSVILAHARVEGSSDVLDADIIKQTSTDEYLMETTDGSSICSLVASETPIQGQAYIQATDSIGSTYFVTKITAHLVLLTQWTDGGDGFLYIDGDEAPWGFDAPDNMTVQVENI